MKSETSQVNNVHFQTDGWERLVKLLHPQDTGSCYLLTDTNTNRDCLDLFYRRSGLDKDQLKTLMVPAGETHKNLHSCLELWNSLSRYGADRSSVLINLGGGVVTDMGGFVASTYQRGIRFVNIPTSLLAMVDASIGGKNGVDLGNLKNQVGIIKEPEYVLIDPGFLGTLDQPQLLSGQAEMYKHGLIHSEKYWEAVKEFNIENLSQSEKLILDSIIIKHNIVAEDPREQGIRKALNFGHTLGHAIESHCLENQDAQGSLLHGEAIAIGMILEVYISSQLKGFPETKAMEVIGHLANEYPMRPFDSEEQAAIIEYMKHDKKNRNGQINFVLLSNFGEVALDQQVPGQMLTQAFKFYNNNLT